jgi:hypothetical protein
MDFHLLDVILSAGKFFALTPPSTKRHTHTFTHKIYKVLVFAVLTSGVAISIVNRNFYRNFLHIKATVTLLLRPRALRFQRLHHDCPQFLEEALLGQSLWKTERQQLRPNQKWYQLQVLPGRTFGTPFDCLLHCFRCVPERLLGVFQTVQCGVCTRVLAVLVQMFAVCGGSDGTDAVQRPEQICLGPNEATIKTKW